MGELAIDPPRAGPRRPMAWAFGLSSGMIAAWLIATALFHELAELMFGDDTWIILAVGLPVIGLALNCAAFAGVFRRAPWASRAAGVRALFCIIAFSWLAYVGFWVVIALILLPPLGLVVMLPWGAELTAEVLFLVAWSRTRARARPAATG